MGIRGVNNYFFDVVFNLDIDKNSYNFDKEEYLNSLPKKVFQTIFIFINAILFIFCFLALVIYIIPVIKSRLCNKKIKAGRYTKLKEKLTEGSEEEFDINERFTPAPV